MMEPKVGGLVFTEADLDFVVGEAAPDAHNKQRLKQLVLEDEVFRKALVGDERVFQRVMAYEEAFVNISPVLYFEILLLKAFKELEVATHTVEQVGKQSIPVFDTREVAEVLARSEVLRYLAQMLASFTRIRSYVISVRVRKGIRRRVRYNDMDIDSLLHFCATVDEEQRFGIYKRIADVCLFLSSVFPEHTLSRHQYTTSSQVRPMPVGRLRRSLQDYEEEGRRFYGLVEEHPTARILKLSEVFGLLRNHFNAARKPLSFIASHYLDFHKQQLLGDRPHPIGGQ